MTKTFQISVQSMNESEILIEATYYDLNLLGL
jgi:hypothetical protein